ncbi:tetratricopeptide repeat protein [Saccharothrix stipae]
MTQSGEASGGSTLFQVGRDLTVRGDVVTRAAPVVPVMESVPGLSWVGRVPVVPGSFVGREEELARLDAAVARSGGRAVVVAVHGLGGVGKSTLAARFAEQAAERFAPVWWITADSAAALDTGLSELAVALVPQAAELTLEQRVELGVRWLASHDGWLLVLDNLTGPNDAAGLLQRVRTGTVVITSRQVGGWRGMSAVALDVLPPAEAVGLLTGIVREQWPQADLTGAERLCAELGRLPLAIEQAGAYIVQTRITPTAYLDLLTRFPTRMFTATAEGGDAQRTAARVWHVTLDRLTDTPIAGDLLRRLAWYAPDNIPRHLLATADDAPEPDLVHALGRLAAYSMITLTADTISVHRLVQAVTRTPDPSDPHRRPDDIARAHRATTNALAAAVLGSDPELPTNWPAFQAVLPHARALLDHTHPDADTAQLCNLADHLGVYLHGQGDITTAIALHTRTAHHRERHDGPDHPATLTSRNDLAGAYMSAGDLARAIPLLETTFADVERVLGPDHPDTLRMRNNLAHAYGLAKDTGRAITLYEATRAHSERVLGPDHPHTLTSRNNLAAAYLSAGDRQRATSLFETTLADIERVLGPDHPHTLRSRNNLAHTYLGAGQPERAIPMFEATLADRQRVLGSDHPDTLSSRHDLARVYQSAGDLARATPLLETALAADERVLGPHHPNTLASRHHLAHAYVSAGDLARAIPLHEANLADRQHVLGTDHPDTLTTRNNLAGAYLSAGDPGRAVPLFEGNLADSERVLGPEHPDTLASGNNLAHALQAVGDTGRAIALFEATSEVADRVLGPDHRVTRAIHAGIKAATNDPP